MGLRPWVTQSPCFAGQPDLAHLRCCETAVFLAGPTQLGPLGTCSVKVCSWQCLTCLGFQGHQWPLAGWLTLHLSDTGPQTLERPERLNARHLVHEMAMWLRSPAMASQSLFHLLYALLELEIKLLAKKHEEKLTRILSFLIVSIAFSSSCERQRLSRYSRHGMAWLCRSSLGFGTSRP